MSEYPKNSKVVAIIPARGGSKGVPNKNIKELCGKPLIAYSIEVAKNSNLIDAVIVSTDSDKIASVAREYGADVPFLRPAEFAQDSARDIEYLQHAIKWLEENRSWEVDIVVLLLPTTPTRTVEDIDSALNLLISSGADSVRTMVDFSEVKPHKMWCAVDGTDRVVPLFSEGLKNIPRQELPKCYMPIAAVYATKVSCIKSGSVWGSDVRMILFPRERYSDIDEIEDFKIAEKIIKDKL